ncbi:MAG: hypothetical protein JNM65_18170 [Verrucomicrobiaceae bacterium]|nr:hypothetical protein [Verrucomicrobiaceae bacterium]
MIVVSDTSVLCYLAVLGKLDLLRDLFGEVTVPNKVIAECLHAGAPEVLRQALQELPPFIHVAGHVELLSETATLDEGEAAAISLAWAHRTEALLLIDERVGRAVARALGLRVRGLLALMADGHRLGTLDFDSSMKILKQNGFRVASPLLQSFRRELRLPETPS